VLTVLLAAAVLAGWLIAPPAVVWAAARPKGGHRG
jgi:hypothetical protein